MESGGGGATSTIVSYTPERAAAVAVYVAVKSIEVYDNTQPWVQVCASYRVVR